MAIKRINILNKLLPQNAKGADGSVRTSSWFRRSITIGSKKFNRGSLINFINAHLPENAKPLKKGLLGFICGSTKKDICNLYSQILQKNQLFKNRHSQLSDIETVSASSKIMPEKVINTGPKKSDFEKGLDVWAEKEGGKAEEAKKRILKAHENGDTSLNLNDLGLKSLPVEIGQLTTLQKLFLSCNKLTSIPPEIGQLSALQYLLLFKNQLTSLPEELGNLPALTYLHLASNDLTNIPAEIGQIAGLMYLDFSNNPNLRQLPISLGSLVELLVMPCSNTQIPESDSLAILEASEQLRAQHALQDARKGFKARLALWQKISKKTHNLTFLADLEDSKIVLINEWLVRLERVKDFRSVKNSILANTVCSILECVGNNASFAETFYAQVDSNNENCHDRAAESFNEIFVNWKLATVPNSASLKEKLQLLVGAAKTFALKAELAKLISAQGKKQGHPLAESVEIYLYYGIALKQPCGLLTFFEEMGYEAMGKCSWINEQALKDTIESTYLAQLADLPQLIKVFEEDSASNDEIETIKQKYADQMSALDDMQEQLSDNEYSEKGKDLMRKSEDEVKKYCLKKATTLLKTYVAVEAAA